MRLRVWQLVVISHISSVPYSRGVRVVVRWAILRGPVPNYFIYRPTSYEIAHVASSSHLRCKWSSWVRV